MTLRTKLAALTLAPIVFLAIYSAISHHSLSKVATGRLIMDKDLVADILPPPSYAIEAYLLSWQLSEEETRMSADDLFKRLKELRTDFESRKDYWNRTLPEGEIREAFKTSARTGQLFLDLISEKLTPLRRELRFEEARRLVVGELSVAYLEHRKAIDQLVILASRQAEVDQEETNALIRFNNWFSLSGPIAMMVLLGGAGYLLFRDTSHKLAKVSNDLQTRSEELTHTAMELSKSTRSLAVSTQVESSAVEETNKAVTQLAEMTRQSAQNAERAREIATSSRSASDSSVASLDRMRTAMLQVQEASDSISKIIGTIDEIAFQTNILALNAAVEAARAGEVGAGFAVVAEEVRALAQRSAQAAKETSSRIADAISKTRHGYDLSREVSTSLGEMVSRARELDDLVEGIANAAKDQTQNLDNLKNASSHMSNGIRDAVGSTQGLAHAGESLEKQAESLKQAVSSLQEVLHSKAAQAS